MQSIYDQSARILDIKYILSDSFKFLNFLKNLGLVLVIKQKMDPCSHTVQVAYRSVEHASRNSKDDD